jgi:hypothetical protein
MERLAHHVDLKAATGTLRGPGRHVVSMPGADRLCIYCLLQHLPATYQRSDCPK